MESGVSERSGTRTKTNEACVRGTEGERSEKEESEQERRQTGLTRWPSGISPAKSVPRSGDSGSTHRRYSRARERMNERERERSRRRRRKMVGWRDETRTAVSRAERRGDRRTVRRRARLST